MTLLPWSNSLRTSPDPLDLVSVAGRDLNEEERSVFFFFSPPPSPPTSTPTDRLHRHHLTEGLLSVPFDVFANLVLKSFLPLYGGVLGARVRLRPPTPEEEDLVKHKFRRFSDWSHLLFKGVPFAPVPHSSPKCLSPVCYVTLVRSTQRQGTGGETRKVKGSVSTGGVGREQSQGVKGSPGRPSKNDDGTSSPEDSTMRVADTSQHLECHDYQPGNSVVQGVGEPISP